MNPRFLGAPPPWIGVRSLPSHFWQMLVRICYIVWQILVPFHPGPQKIAPLPEPTIDISESHVKQCQWIFDQAAARRVQLEQKAQSTFSLMVFLVPVLASLFVYLSGRYTTAGTVNRTLVISFLLFAAVFLLLGFISAVRAVGVKTMETLFLGSVVDDEGQFREYKHGFHARGLLYCAAMNEAMNDHIAQFVKGAYILTAAAVLTVVITVVPTMVVLSALPSPPTETKIVGPVEVSSADLRMVRDDLANLKKEIGHHLLSSRGVDDWLKRSEEKLARMDEKLKNINGRLTEMQKGNRVVPPKQGA
jgi:hypothetical protein